MVMASGTNSYYVRLGEGSDWVKETHCAVKAEWKFTFLWFYDFFIFYLVFYYILCVKLCCGL